MPLTLLSTTPKVTSQKRPFLLTKLPLLLLLLSTFFFSVNGLYAQCAVGQAEVEFSDTGGIETFTVPDGVTSLTITAVGADGGFFGGSGATTTSTFSVLPGQELEIVVGIAGVNGSFSGGGGGGSGIRIAFDETLLMIAGGGGGGGNAGNGGGGGNGGFGGSGGSGDGGNGGFGAAGGGGYSGGDGGGDGFGTAGGGGSFIAETGTDNTITAGTDGGGSGADGSVTICYTPADAAPVTMTYFRSTPQAKHIQLEWATANEVNNEGFEVQRSIDGSSFVNVGWVNGRGTANEEQTYQFTDDEVQANTTYFYRLQQMDIDGTSAFSPVRSAMITDGKLVQVTEFFPNPVGKGTGVASFHVNMPEAGQMAIQLIDAQGRLVKEFNQEYAAGQSTFALPVMEVRAGQYFVRMQLGKEVLYRKLVVN